MLVKMHPRPYYAVGRKGCVVVTDRTETVADLAQEFKRVSRLTRKFHQQHGGYLNASSQTETAYYANSRKLFTIEQRLREAGCASIAVLLRVEHELSIGMALRDETLVERRRSLRATRGMLATWLNGGEVGQRAVASEDYR